MCKCDGSLSDFWLSYHLFSNKLPLNIQRPRERSFLVSRNLGKVDKVWVRSMYCKRNLLVPQAMLPHWEPSCQLVHLPSQAQPHLHPTPKPPGKSGCADNSMGENNCTHCWLPCTSKKGKHDVKRICYLMSACRKYSLWSIWNMIFNSRNLEQVLFRFPVPGKDTFLLSN